LTTKSFFTNQYRTLRVLRESLAISVYTDNEERSKKVASARSAPEDGVSTTLHPSTAYSGVPVRLGESQMICCWGRGWTTDNQNGGNLIAVRGGKAKPKENKLRVTLLIVNSTRTYEYVSKKQNTSTTSSKRSCECGALSNQSPHSCSRGCMEQPHTSSCSRHQATSCNPSLNHPPAYQRQPWPNVRLVNLRLPKVRISSALPKMELGKENLQLLKVDR
jgi:hypothetical protein